MRALFLILLLSQMVNDQVMKERGIFLLIISALVWEVLLLRKKVKLSKEHPVSDEQIETVFEETPFRGTNLLQAIGDRSVAYNVARRCIRLAHPSSTETPV